MIHGLVVFVLLQSYEDERRLRAELELRCQKVTLELADTKQHIQEGDYRRENYPTIRRYVMKMTFSISFLYSYFPECNFPTIFNFK